MLKEDNICWINVVLPKLHLTMCPTQCEFEICYVHKQKTCAIATTMFLLLPHSTPEKNGRRARERLPATNFGCVFHGFILAFIKNTCRPVCRCAGVPPGSQLSRTPATPRFCLWCAFLCRMDSQALVFWNVAPIDPHRNTLSVHESLMSSHGFDR